jgi:NAD(P)-dependent dehydrogenase (short-subunit alcohol dehydrogenase family)
MSSKGSRTSNEVQLNRRESFIMDFTNKVAVVTGASSGIGRATALAFSRAGASVLAVGRNRGALTEVVDLMAEMNAPAQVCACDVTEPDGPARVVTAATESFGGIDVLVNAAGIIAMGPVAQTDDELWDRVMGVNVRAPFRLMRAALPSLRARRGAVVNISSVNGLRVFPGLAAYNVSKAALDHLTRCAAIELAPDGIRVNAVNPGVTVTNLHRRSGMDEERYAAFLFRARETHPLGRPGEAEEIAALVVFLASDRAAWITGETIAIDGGRHLTCAR